MKTKLILLIAMFFSCLPLGLYAQNISFKGNIINESGETIPYTTVCLLAKPDSAVLLAVLSNNDGSFELNAHKGEYILSASSVGYANQYKDIHTKESMSIETIVMKKDLINIDEVEVVAKRPTIVSKSDRLVFNVAETAEALASNSIYDLLAKTPSLIIDIANKTINIVGKGSVNVMVNGRLLNLSGDALTAYLSSLSPQQVESIEVISTPPSRYDAEGNAGLLNIRLKSTPKDYLGGSATAQYKKRGNGQDYGGNYSLNFSKGKWSLNNSVSYNNSNQIGDLEVMQEQFNKFMFESKSKINNAFENLGVGFGTDYQANEKSILGARYNYTNNSSANAIVANNDNYIFHSGEYKLDNIAESQNPERSKGNVHNMMLYSDFDLDTLGSKLSFNVGAIVERSKGTAELDVTSEYSNGRIEEALMQSTQDGSKDIYTANVDWIKVGGFGTLGLGGKLSFSNSQSAYLEYLNHSTEANNNRSSNFEYTEDIQATYADFSKQMKSWDIRLGLRAENTITKSHEFRIDSINKNSYFELFPTFNLSYTDKKNNSFSFNYNRRLTRPWMWALNPSRFYLGQSSVIIGNPFLRPMMGSYLSFKYAKNTFSFMVGANYKDQMFNSQTLHYSEEDNIFVVERFNNYKEQSYYANINYQFDKFSWWNSYNLISATYFKNENTDSRFDMITNEGYSLYFRTNNTFHPLSGENKDKLSLSVNYQYRPTINGGRDIRFSNSSLDMGANWNAIKSKLTLSIWASDVFAKNAYRGKSIQNGVFTYSNEYFAHRSVQLSVKYNFGGNMKVKQKGVNEEEMNRL